MVVGGGQVAERKVRLLLRFNALVRVISPKIVKSLRILSEKGRIEVIHRPYAQGDLEGAALVFAATDNDGINKEILREASSKGIPVNVVDNPDLCDFIVPSVAKRGPITIAISTSGSLPMLSKLLRKEIEKLISEDYLKYVSILGEFRRLLIGRIKDKKKRSRIMKELGQMELRELNAMNVKDLEKRYLDTAG